MKVNTKNRSPRRSSIRALVSNDLFLKNPKNIPLDRPARV